MLPKGSCSLLTVETDERVAKKFAGEALSGVSSAFSSFLAPKVNSTGASDDSGFDKKFNLVDWESEILSVLVVIVAGSALPNLKELAVEVAFVLAEEESVTELFFWKANVEFELKSGLLLEATESDDDELDLIRAAKVLDDSASLASSLGIS